ncbi:efflux RND transporter permease subunit, partial [Patescibacteria group bacterium]
VGEFIKPLPIIVSVSMMASVFIALFFTLPSMMVLVGFKVANRVKKLIALLSGFAILVIGIVIIPKSALFAPTLLVFVLLFISVIVLRRYIWRDTKKKLFKSGQSRKVAQYFSLAFRRGFISLTPLTESYRNVITFILETPRRRNRVLITITIFTLFSYLLFPLGFIESEFFPKSGGDRIYLTLELPLGTNNNVSEQKAKELMPQITENEYVSFVTAEIGQGYSDGFEIGQAEANSVLFTSFLIDEDKRPSSLNISKDLRTQFATYNEGELNVIDANMGGPPAGADIDIALVGEDLNTLQGLADQVVSFLENTEGLTNIEKSVKSGKTKIVFDPDKPSLIKNGLTESTIGFWLRTYIYGFDVKTINFEGEEKDTIIRVSNDLITPEALSSIEIPKEGARTPISELGTFKIEPNPNLITRKNGDRTITITASTKPGFNPVNINKKVQKYADENLNLPQGYTWETGGSNEMNEEAVQSIFRAMLISAILILVTMVVQLGSFRKALIVMLVIPLAISGVFIFFAITATPLSLPAMMGLLALFGIVIANSLMIVDKITKNLNIGFKLEQAIPEAATSRIEPILLTSAAQVIGLIPATLADPIWRGFGGAIIFGLSFSGTIMLFFIPIVYFYFFPELRKK